MKPVALLLLLAFVVVACEKKEEPVVAKPVSEAGEKLYDIRGKILSRTASDNTVYMDHEEIPGFMPAMQMAYVVRGVEVKNLPADGKKIVAKLHVTDRAYWLTDVKAVP